MPDKKNKNTSPLPGLDVNQIADDAIEHVKKQEGYAFDAVKYGDDYATQRETIDNVFDASIDPLSQQITNWEDARKKAYQQDETAQKWERGMKNIAGLSDGLSALANLIGVARTNGAPASHQQLQGASPALTERFEKARLERQADIKSIDDRLDLMRRQQDALRLQKGQALADLDARAIAQKAKEKEMADEKQWRQDEALKERVWRTNERMQTQAYDTARQEDLQAHQKALNDADNASMERRYKAQADGTFKGEEFNLGGGEFVRVPKERMTEYNITELYDMVPDSIKQSAGRPKMDAYGTIVGYYPPTQKEMLQAINRAAQNDENIKQAIRNLGASNPTTPSSGKSGRDWSNRRDANA